MLILLKKRIQNLMRVLVFYVLLNLIVSCATFDSLCCIYVAIYVATCVLEDLEDLHHKQSYLTTILYSKGVIYLGLMRVKLMRK
jgi:hypothetical protein